MAEYRIEDRQTTKGLKERKEVLARKLSFHFLLNCPSVLQPFSTLSTSSACSDRFSISSGPPPRLSATKHQYKNIVTTSSQVAQSLSLSLSLSLSIYIYSQSLYSPHRHQPYCQPRKATETRWVGCAGETFIFSPFYFPLAHFPNSLGFTARGNFINICI